MLILRCSFADLSASFKHMLKLCALCVCFIVIGSVSVEASHIGQYGESALQKQSGNRLCHYQEDGGRDKVWYEDKAQVGGPYLGRHVPDERERLLVRK